MKTDYPVQVNQVDFAVPTHYTIGPRFLSWGEAVNHARSLIQRTVYKGQRVRPHMDDYHPRRKFQDGDDLISYSRSFVQMRVVEPVQDRADSAVRHGNDGVAMTWEVFHDGTVESRPDDRDVPRPAKPKITREGRVHPADKDYGNDAYDAIQAQPAIQQMTADYIDLIAQLEAQIDDLKNERAELKRADRTDDYRRYSELVSLLHNGVTSAMLQEAPNPWHMPAPEAIALVARLWVAARNYSAASPVEIAPESAPAPAGVPVSVYSPDSELKPLFSGRRVGGAPWAFWSRVVPDDGFIDLPPVFRIENQ